MPLEEKKSIRPVAQNLILENRERLSVSGVMDVVSFDDESVVIDTEMGLLTVRGAELHINRLNVENQELIVEGDIFNCSYSDKNYMKTKGLGLLGRIFR